ncbi:dihydrofolate reductase [Gryllotalpicola ginsengisoli]|uniref:dihydrofolate reductase n=1 Tax=Gryllotalpicola ginsengisoli TaxID=444608 RepID=UPI0003B79170|nr:dihydrofolate reductase [Gryllotalpicola ginsengisoli]
MATPSLALIWAQTTAGVIGGAGAIPWHIPGEQRRFKELTAGGTVIMGRATWESLPARVRPLPGRDNIVVTRQTDFRADGATVVHSIEAALQAADPSRQAWCIGGAQLYAQTIGMADRLEVTYVELDAPGDAYAPMIGAEWRESGEGADAAWLESPEGLRYRFARYLR